jgi:hypothetical protein
MKGLKIFLLILGAFISLGVGGIFVIGKGDILLTLWAITMGAPDLPFDERTAVTPPDYSDLRNWAALPSREGLEDMIPAGLVDRDIQGESPVDVFFIHPTGYLRGDSWTFSMDMESATEENTQWLMANQASVYNGCCKVYAPRYRQAHILTYMQDEPVQEPILDVAYQDVRRAFRFFLEHRSNGRPFVLAGHSQGTHHGVRLLEEEIDSSELARRLVVSYMIGGFTKREAIENMSDITLCDSASDLHCVVHWDTWSETMSTDDIIEMTGRDPTTNICTNPLSWRLDGGFVDKKHHKGAIESSGAGQLEMWGADVASGVVFGPLGEPISALVHARCENGSLHISDLSESEFSEEPGVTAGNYHGIDYSMFYMDIRENAKLRTSTYLANYGEQGDSP